MKPLALLCALIASLGLKWNVLATDLICCGMEEVFIIPTDAEDGAKKWSWQASESPQIPADSHKWFRTTDECKPVGDHLLITSSSGGVALIRRKDKQCDFLARVGNAHSACLLPGGLIAVAGSTSSNIVVLFDRTQKTIPAVAKLTFPLKGAHGVRWDRKRNRLWALGEAELVLLEIRDAAFHEEKRWPLPKFGGHDLSPAMEPDQFFITVDEAVFVFDCGKLTFTPHPLLGDFSHVKSIDFCPTKKLLAIQQANSKQWWSHQIQFVADDASKRRVMELKDEKLYKTRWDIPTDADFANFTEPNPKAE